MSKHFKEREFACPCCGAAYHDEELTWLLETIRKVIGNKPIIINSGYRCEQHNASLPNSSPTSQHMIGRAADIRVNGMSSLALYNACKGVMWHGGLGLYNNHVHVDVRDNDRLVTWDKRK